MRVIDTENNRELYVKDDSGHYQLLEVADPGEYQSGWYHVGFPVKWQVSYLAAEEFESRLGDQYKRK